VPQDVAAPTITRRIRRIIMRIVVTITTTRRSPLPAGVRIPSGSNFIEPSEHVVLRAPTHASSCPCSPPIELDLVSTDTVSERLRRWTRNPLGSARRGSNPLGVEFHILTLQGETIAKLLDFTHQERATNEGKCGPSPSPSPPLFFEVLAAPPGGLAASTLKKGEGRRREGSQLVPQDAAVGRVQGAPS
jgi:hypothetical protein